MSRIGVLGLHCECSSFSPLLSREEDFELLRGEALLTKYPFLPEQHEFVPLLWAGALPGGCIERGFYQRFEAELLQKLRDAAPFDGLFLHMHGAAKVEGSEDCEAVLLSRIREIVGEDCILSASYDLHGNLSEAAFAQLDLLTAYRTAPHIDVRETLERACNLLLHTTQSGQGPWRAMIRVPVLYSGEQTSTNWEPGKQLWASIEPLIERFELLDASILAGYIWADEPRSAASVVTMGNSAEQVRAAALELGQRFWELRADFDFESPAASMDECLAWAEQPGPTPVVLSDSGDNPTAGGAGDLSFALERMLSAPTQDAIYASIPDPAAVRLCLEAGVGAELELSLGGHLDPGHGGPLALRAELQAIVPPDPQPRPRTPACCTNVVLRCGGVRIIVTEERAAFHRLQDFLRLGLDPRDCALLVVKIGYLVSELRALAGRDRIALTPGAVSQDFAALPYRRLARPIYPFDPELHWSPAEQLVSGRRGQS
ncbi:MAG: microcystin degradation protein MlrC [Planctomycetota bacterium]|nr:MAG: microcystin degradation protein MlrC [Planctomycetota bacterium]